VAGGSLDHGGGGSAPLLTDGGELLLWTRRAFLSYARAALSFSTTSVSFSNPSSPMIGQLAFMSVLWLADRAHLPLPQASVRVEHPRVRHPEQADRWTWLVLAAFTQLRLAGGCVADRKLPWERRYDPGRLRPVRVHRTVSALLGHLGTPAKPPKPCGRSPGRPKGRLSGRAERYPAIKKSA
jgi:hypothetical protein